MNVIITGAGKGIGFSTTKVFATNLHNVIAISRNIDKLNQLAFEFNSLGKGKIIPLKMDLTNQDYSILQNHIAEFNQIHILINNAAILVNKPFTETTDEEWLNIYETNVFAAVRLIKYLIPYFSHSVKSHIVNISSMGGYQGSVKFRGLSAYSSSKSALANLTEVLAVELESYNIAVNCLALGSVQTEMLEAAFPNYRANLNPDEIAEFIYQFAISGSKFFNGKILPVSNSTP